MRRHLLAAMLSLAAAPALAATDTPKATVDAFFAGFAKGDLAAVGALHTANPVIIDELPPHAWHGPKAFATWAADLESFDKSRGVTEGVLATSAPTREESDGRHAYVVVPVDFAFKLKGTPVHEAASMAFALTHDKTGWKISGWSFAGAAATKK